MQGDSEALLRVFIDQAPVPIAMLDRDMRYIAASRQWISDYRFAHQPWRGVSHYELFPDLPERWRPIHRRALAGEGVANNEDCFERADGTVQWLRWEVRPWYHEDAQGGIIIFAEDISERKKSEQRIVELNTELEERVHDRTAQLEDSVMKLEQALATAEVLRRELREQAIRDPLTGLFNRRFLEESMRHEIARARRTDASIGVIMLDIDEFKRLNDTHGHGAGDSLLCEVAHVLASNIRAGDVACRFGGDEFILLLPGASPDGMTGKAQQLREVIRLTGATCSTGAALYPADGASGAELMRAADLALYRAKKCRRPSPAT